jgi:hypothetical protein
MSRHVFDRAGLVARRLRGQGKGRCRGWLRTMALRRYLRDVAELAAISKEIRALGLVPRGLKRKAHTWYMTADRRAA